MARPRSLARTPAGFGGVCATGCRLGPGTGPYSKRRLSHSGVTDPRWTSGGLAPRWCGPRVGQSGGRVPEAPDAAPRVPPEGTPRWRCSGRRGRGWQGGSAVPLRAGGSGPRPLRSLSPQVPVLSVPRAGRDLAVQLARVCGRLSWTRGVWSACLPPGQQGWCPSPTGDPWGRSGDVPSVPESDHLSGAGLVGTGL